LAFELRTWGVMLQGELLLDPRDGSARVVAEEFAAARGDTWSSKDMLQLIRRKSQVRGIESRWNQPSETIPEKLDASKTWSSKDMLRLIHRNSQAILTYESPMSCEQLEQPGDSWTSKCMLQLIRRKS